MYIISISYSENISIDLVCGFSDHIKDSADIVSLPLLAYIPSKGPTILFWGNIKEVSTFKTFPSVKKRKLCVHKFLMDPQLGYMYLPFSVSSSQFAYRELCVISKWTLI